jgi:uncharacterized membrane protein
VQRRWLSLILGLSVALNLFCLGLFSARQFRGHEPRAEHAGQNHAPGPSRRFRQRPRPFEWMSEAERDQLRPRRKELRATRRAAEEALRAQPFEIERLRAALGRLRSETDAIQASVHDFMLQRAGSMNAEERQRLADAQWGPARDESRGSGGPRRGGPRGDEGRGEPHEPQPGERAPENGPH